MAKKYEQLVSLYRDEIEKCHRLKAKVDEARQVLKEYDLSTDNDNYDYQIAENLAMGWQAANDEYMIAMSELAQDIDNEYYDVPYTKRRQQGIEKFWELAGLK